MPRHRRRYVRKRERESARDGLGVLGGDDQGPHQLREFARGDERVAARVDLDEEVVVEVGDLERALADRGKGRLEVAPLERAGPMHDLELVVERGRVVVRAAGVAQAAERAPRVRAADVRVDAQVVVVVLPAAAAVARVGEHDDLLELVEQEVDRLRDGGGLRGLLLLLVLRRRRLRGGADDFAEWPAGKATAEHGEHPRRGPVRRRRHGRGDAEQVAVGRPQDVPRAGDQRRRGRRRRRVQCLEFRDGRVHPRALAVPPDKVQSAEAGRRRGARDERLEFAAPRLGRARPRDGGQLRRRARVLLAQVRDDVAHRGADARARVGVAQHGAPGPRRRVARVRRIFEGVVERYRAVRQVERGECLARETAPQVALVPRLPEPELERLRRRRREPRVPRVDRAPRSRSPPPREAETAAPPPESSVVVAASRKHTLLLLVVVVLVVVLRGRDAVAAGAGGSFGATRGPLHLAAPFERVGPVAILRRDVPQRRRVAAPLAVEPVPADPRRPGAHVARGREVLGNHNDVARGIDVADRDGAVDEQTRDEVGELGRRARCREGRVERGRRRDSDDARRPVLVSGGGIVRRARRPLVLLRIVVVVRAVERSRPAALARAQHGEERLVGAVVGAVVLLFEVIEKRPRRGVVVVVAVDTWSAPRPPLRSRRLIIRVRVRRRGRRVEAMGPRRRRRGRRGVVARRRRAAQSRAARRARARVLEVVGRIDDEQHVARLGEQRRHEARGRQGRLVGLRARVAARRVWRWRPMIHEGGVPRLVARRLDRSPARVVEPAPRVGEAIDTFQRILREDRRRRDEGVPRVAGTPREAVVAQLARAAEDVAVHRDGRVEREGRLLAAQQRRQVVDELGVLGDDLGRPQEELVRAPSQRGADLRPRRRVAEQSRLVGG
mmetsp:Transcript_15677/g.63145  ORF Transcript_15677/g.63145 Transcript_15677/m.63145 type:complete len:898 (-) Transcript_15677:1144-3837(-)